MKNQIQKVKETLGDIFFKYNKSGDRINKTAIMEKNLDFEKWFLWKIVLHKIMLRTKSKVMHRIDKKTLTLRKISFCMKGRFYIKII